MTETLELVSTTKEAAHDAATAIYRRAQQVIADGKPARMLVEPAEDDRSLRQNNFYWGIVLKQISEQAAIEGQRWAAEAWHELMKRQFLGYEIKKVTVAGRRRKLVTRQLRSTTKLKVRSMSKYLEQVMAFAATDLGVQFTETRWEDYRG